MSNGSDQPSQLSPLKRAFLALEDMQAKLAASEHAKREPIAIIGLGCRLPGDVDNPAAFWQLLCEGRDAIVEVPSDRWDINAYYDPDPNAPGKMSTRHGGFLNRVDQFDPLFFGISPREAVSMDPQQRLLLEVTWEALEHAGQAPDQLSGSATGVFVAIATTDYAQLQLQSAGLAGLDAYNASGVAHSVASGRISYVLGLHGPSISIDTACSSSLVATHLAVQSLRSGECRMALAGGVNLILSPENSVTLSKYHMMAPDGHCKTFDAAADGFVRAEGCGMVVLKRLSDAQADGDTILAVIRGSAVNQDGPSSGLTAPNGPAQEAVIRAALANGGVAAHEVSYVETHGTGTALGDPIEVQALGAALGEGRSLDTPFAIGSVKTNIGHPEGVAGVAGLIKAVLMLQHGEIPPHLHLHQRNPHIAWDDIPVIIPTERTPWRPSGERRIAGVSSFGFSGTNAHVVLEAAPAPAPSTVTDERPLHLLALGAKSEPALRTLADRYAQLLTVKPDQNLADMCYTANSGRAHFAHRLAITASTSDELRERLARVAAGDTPIGALLGTVERVDRPKVAFLFTGQGAQYAGMGRELYQTQPTFRAALDRCAAILRPQLNRDIVKIILAQLAEADALLDDTTYTQPALFAIEYALSELWRSWGVEPSVVMGHSVGEYVAAVVAGVFSLEDGLKLIAARGRLMGALPAGGAMAAIFADLAQVQSVIGSYGEQLAIAAVNGPAHTVISGTAAAVQTVADAFAATGVRVQRLTVSHAFHSPLMEPMLSEFERAADEVSFSMPHIRLISNVTGQFADKSIATPGYWRRHIRATVEFARSVETLHQQGCTMFVECGPHPVLLGMARHCLPADTGTWLPSLRKGRDDWQQILESLATLYVSGGVINWAGFDRDAPRRKLALPTYPFQRARYWIEQKPAQRSATRRNVDSTAHPLLGARLRSALKATQFEAALSVATSPLIDDHRVYGTPILPATAYIEMALAASHARGGHTALEDLLIHDAMVFNEHDERAVQTVVTPETGGAATLQIFSQGANEEEWKLHASARLSPAARIAMPQLSVADVQARCTTLILADEHYAGLRAHGLDFGPSLHGVQQIWRRDGEALGEIQLPEALEIGASAYHIQPALLDACIQVLALAMPSSADTFLPINLEQLTLHAPLGTRVWSHVQLREPASAQRETLVGDITVFDETGRMLVELSGLRLKRASSAALRRLSDERFDEWLYEVAWRPQPPLNAAEQCAATFLPEAQQISDYVETRFDTLDVWQDLAPFHELIPQLDALSAAYIVQAFRELGWEPQPGEHVTTSGLAQRLGVVAQQRRQLGRLLDILAEDGILRAADTGWHVVRTPEVTNGLELLKRNTALLDHYPAFDAELEFTERCGAELAGALNGTVDPLQLLFPGGSIETAEKLYQQSPVTRAYNALVQQAIDAVVASLPADCPLRMLEIGGGTGGTTAFVLPQLPAERTQYTFTDISPAFTAKAAHKFRDFPFVSYQPLNIEHDPEAQGFAPGQFDVILAVNMIHATADLRQTLRHTQRLLAPGGLLLVIEMTEFKRWIDLSFGLTDGWWRFTDADIRPSYPLMPRENWLQLLAELDFDAAAISTADGRLADQTILLARTPCATKQEKQLGGHWLILADANGVGEDVAEQIAARGGQPLLVRPGASYQKIQPDNYEVNPTQVEDFTRLLRETPNVQGVIHLWSLDTPARPTASELAAAQKRCCGSALFLTQALANGGMAPRVWLVTRGAQAVDSTPAAEQAPLWGLGKVIALEHPELHCTRIDLDPAAGVDHTQAILGEILTPNAEDQVAIRSAERYVARLVHSAVEQPLPVQPTAQPVELAFTARGTLDNLLLQPIMRRQPGPGEVEIEVYATGLNFKDVLNTLGMYPGDPGPLGGECSGVIVAVGAGVDGLQAGDAVVAVHAGCFRSFATLSANLVALKPAHLSFEEAASVAIPYITAAFALNHLGQMQRGERVLIHAAAGGVGLAAVQLAQHAGAEIFATAGSPEKRAYLRTLGVQHVLDSRSLHFADEIMVLTGGEGIDLVLNSLAGEFVGRSLALLRHGGRFLEIGKRDHLSAEHAAGMDRDIAYHVIDWGENARQEPALIRLLLRDILAKLDAGELTPLPLRVFALHDATEAFRYMAQAKHIGKIVVSQRDTSADSGQAVEVRSDSTYLVTGGLRGLGLLAAEWLVERGARHLALMGRSGADEAARTAIARLEQTGAHIVVIAGDVARSEDVARALVAIEQTLPPLRGIIHSAGVLADAALTQQDWSHFQYVLGPKVDGAWHLHTQTARMPLDFFVLYSSIASLLGSPGQGNHAAANAFLDALAHHRRARGLPATSINWGAWSEVGAAAERNVGERIGLQGVGTIAPEAGMRVFEQLLAHARPQVGVMPVQWSTFLRRFAGGAPMFYAELASAEQPDVVATAPPVKAASDVQQRLSTAAPHKRRAMLLSHVQEHAGRVLSVAAAQIGERVPLNELGLDSLMAVELRNVLGSSLALARPLPATLVFDYPTVAAITDYLASEALHFPEPEREQAPNEQLAPATPDEGAAVVTMLGALEELSDEEIDRLFAEQARNGA